MSSYFSETEKANMLSIFAMSFDTWSRSITVFKEAVKVETTPSPSTDNNTFGFGEIQQNPVYTYLPPRTGVFMAILKDSDIDSTLAQAVKAGLSPEIMARIVANPLSIKVKEDAFAFIEDGRTEKIVDNLGGDTYLLDGHGCLQTFQGSKYYVYPLRKTT